MPLMTLQEEDHVIKGLVLRIKMMVQDVAEDQTDRAYLLDELAERLLTEADRMRKLTSSYQKPTPCCKAHG